MVFHNKMVVFNAYSIEGFSATYFLKQCVLNTYCDNKWVGKQKNFRLLQRKVYQLN